MRGTLFLTLVLVAFWTHPTLAQKQPKQCIELAKTDPHNAVAEAFSRSHVVALLGPLSVDGYQIEKVWKGDVDGFLKFEGRPTYFENNLIFAKRSRPFGPLTDVYGPCFNNDMSVLSILESQFGAGALAPETIVDSKYSLLIVSTLFAIAFLALVGMSFLSWITSKFGKQGDSSNS